MCRVAAINSSPYFNIVQFIQLTLVTTTAFVPKNVASEMNLLVYRILKEQIDV